MKAGAGGGSAQPRGALRRTHRTNLRRLAADRRARSAESFHDSASRYSTAIPLNRWYFGLGRFTANRATSLLPLGIGSSTTPQRRGSSTTPQRRGSSTTPQRRGSSTSWAKPKIASRFSSIPHLKRFGVLALVYFPVVFLALRAFSSLSRTSRGLSFALALPAATGLFN